MICYNLLLRSFYPEHSRDTIFQLLIEQNSYSIYDLFWQCLRLTKDLLWFIPQNTKNALTKWNVNQSRMTLLNVASQVSQCLKNLFCNILNTNPINVRNGDLITHSWRWFWHFYVDYMLCLIIHDFYVSGIVHPQFFGFQILLYIFCWGLFFAICWKCIFVFLRYFKL